MLALTGRMGITAGMLAIAGRKLADSASEIRALTSVARIGNTIGPEPALTVNESVDESCLLDNVNMAEGRLRFAEACTALDLTVEPSLLIGDVGGERATLLAVALACVRISAVIVVDDIDRGVDIATQHRIVEALDRLTKMTKTGPAIIVTTADRGPVSDLPVIVELPPRVDEVRRPELAHPVPHPGTAARRDADRGAAAGHLRRPYHRDSGGAGPTHHGNPGGARGRGRRSRSQSRPGFRSQSRPEFRSAVPSRIPRPIPIRCRASRTALSPRRPPVPARSARPRRQIRTPRHPPTQLPPRTPDDQHVPPGRLRTPAVQGPLPILALLFLVLVPLLYGALYLWSNWDPYGKLDQVPVAVVNLDQPVTTRGRQDHRRRQPAGQRAAGAIRSSTGSSSTPTRPRPGLADGTYKLTVVIPPEFSANLASGSGERSAARHRLPAARRRQRVRHRAADHLGAEAARIRHQPCGDRRLLRYRFRRTWKPSGATSTTAADQANQLATGTAASLKGATDLSTAITTAADGSTQLVTGLADDKAASAQLVTDATAPRPRPPSWPPV